ncbi:MAG TPA: SGNH/GDSL hydrolase family protein [Fimbriimonadaceae bacterium]|nr:SGNH/GDSL hydrolase family protein [Fimbriimonadaceae bacterium]
MISMLGALLCLATPAPKDMRLLFFGNSHTAGFNVPAMVESLLENDGSGRKVAQVAHTGGLLLNHWGVEEYRKEVSEGKWSAVILQGAGMSSSHKYKYSQEGAIGFARLAVKSGAQTLLFAEWPRRGWNETGYIMGIYQGIRKAAPGSEVIPVPQSFDAARKRYPALDLWAPDGNHSNQAGAYLAACVIAKSLGGMSAKATWTPSGLDPKLAANLRSIARQTSGRTPAKG